MIENWYVITFGNKRFATQLIVQRRRRRIVAAKRIRNKNKSKLCTVMVVRVAFVRFFVEVRRNQSNRTTSPAFCLCIIGSNTVLAKPEQSRRIRIVDTLTQRECNGERGYEYPVENTKRNYWTDWIWRSGTRGLGLDVESGLWMLHQSITMRVIIWLVLVFTPNYPRIAEAISASSWIRVSPGFFLGNVSKDPHETNTFSSNSSRICTILQSIHQIFCMNFLGFF